MIIYYSGDGSSYSQPEILLQEEATLMLTYYNQQRNVSGRFAAILAARKATTKTKTKKGKGRRHAR